MSYRATYRYRCTSGHESSSPRPLEQCPARTRGKPCTGDLSRFGEGSRSKRQEGQDGNGRRDGDR